jgi:predicted DNA-binding transcriptional regulator AlpA
LSFSDVFPHVIQISRSKAYEEIAKGNFPRLVKIGRSSLLHRPAVRALIARLNTGAAE